MTVDALFRQVSNLADNLTPQTVGEYVDLPSNVRVADVRRLRLANRLHATMGGRWPLKTPAGKI